MTVPIDRPPEVLPVVDGSGNVSTDWLVFFQKLYNRLEDLEARVTVNDAK